MLNSCPNKYFFKIANFASHNFLKNIILNLHLFSLAHHSSILEIIFLPPTFIIYFQSFGYTDSMRL